MQAKCCISAVPNACHAMLPIRNPPMPFYAVPCRILYMHDNQTLRLLDGEADLKTAVVQKKSAHSIRAATKRPMAAPKVDTAMGAAAPGALGAWGDPVSEDDAVGVAVETRLTDPLGLVPLMDVRGMAERVSELAMELVMVEEVPFALATLVTTLDDSAVLDGAADELEDEDWSTKVATMRISVHCAPMDSS